MPQNSERSTKNPKPKPKPKRRSRSFSPQISFTEFTAEQPIVRFDKRQFSKEVSRVVPNPYDRSSYQVEFVGAPQRPLWNGKTLKGSYARAERKARIFVGNCRMMVPEPGSNEFSFGQSLEYLASRGRLTPRMSVYASNIEVPLQRRRDFLARLAWRTGEQQLEQTLWHETRHHVQESDRRRFSDIISARANSEALMVWFRVLPALAVALAYFSNEQQEQVLNSFAVFFAAALVIPQVLSPFLNELLYTISPGELDAREWAHKKTFGAVMTAEPVLNLDPRSKSHRHQLRNPWSVQKKTVLR